MLGLGDIFLAVALVAAAVVIGVGLAKRLRIPMSPFLVVGAGLIAVAFLFHMPTSPIFIGFHDGEKYQEWGFSMANTWQKGLPWTGEQIWPGKGFWPAIIAIFHSIAGPVTVSLLVFNALTVAFAVLILQKATAIIFNASPKISFMVLTLSSPPILLNGPTLLREALFWLGVSLCVLALAYLSLNKIPNALANLMAGTVVVLAVRPNFGVVLVYLVMFSCVAAWVLNERIGLKSRALWGGVFSLALVASFPLVFGYLATDVSGLEDRVTTISASLSKERVTTAIPDNPSPTTSEVSKERVTTAIPDNPSPTTSEGGKFHGLASENVVANSLSRLPNLFLGPFFWEVGSEPIWIVALFSTFHYWYLGISSGALIWARRSQNTISLVLFGLSVLTLISLSPVMANYGIVIRFRVVSELILLPLAAVATETLVARIGKWRASRDFSDRFSWLAGCCYPRRA